MLVVWGTHHFHKNVGHYGPVQTCPNCGSTYQKDYIKESNWGHIYYIPLLPVGSSYYKVCPICYASEKITSKQAKEEMNSFPPVNQSLVPRVIRHTGSGNYDMYVEDQLSGHKYLLCEGAAKSRIKEIEKNRFYKNVSETQAD